MSQTHTDLLCVIFSLRTKEVQGGTVSKMWFGQVIIAALQAATQNTDFTGFFKPLNDLRNCMLLCFFSSRAEIEGSPLLCDGPPIKINPLQSQSISPHDLVNPHKHKDHHSPWLLSVSKMELNNVSPLRLWWELYINRVQEERDSSSGSRVRRP